MPQAVAIPVMLALTAVSTGVGVYSAVSSGKAQAESSKFNAAVARNNALVTRQQAEYDAARIRDKNRRVIGMQRAAIAGNQLELSGSMQDVLVDSAIQGELDVATAIYQGKVSAGNQYAQARLDERQASSAMSAGWLNAGATLLGGVSTGAGHWYNPDLNPSMGTKTITPKKT